MIAILYSIYPFGLCLIATENNCFILLIVCSIEVIYCNIRHFSFYILGRSHRVFLTTIPFFEMWKGKTIYLCPNPRFAILVLQKTTTVGGKQCLAWTQS